VSSTIPVVIRMQPSQPESADRSLTKMSRAASAATIDDARGPTRTGSSGKAGRSREEIETIFDRNKGAIYALYNRATRSNPELQGKLVLEFTITPDGQVTMCRVISSELNDKELEGKIVSLVKLFHFEAKDEEKSNRNQLKRYASSRVMQRHAQGFPVHGRIDG